jgi:small redox-active disulfide protein 2
MLDIKVLGPGCANCEKLDEMVHNVVDSLSIEAQVSKVTNYTEIVELGVMTTPGLIINGEVVSSGRVPTLGEVTTMITNALAN